MTARKTAPSFEFESAEEFPRATWRWPNFTPREMSCKGTGRLMVHPSSMDKLQRLRNEVGAPLVINSAYRTREHNKRVGGAAGSLHLAARAYDVSMKGHDPHEFETIARHVGFTGFGYYPEHGFMHIDTGPARWWGDPWPHYEDEGAELPDMANVLAPDDAARLRVIEQLRATIAPPKIAHPLKRKAARV